MLELRGKAEERGQNSTCLNPDTYPRSHIPPLCEGIFLLAILLKMNLLLGGENRQKGTGTKAAIKSDSKYTFLLCLTRTVRYVVYAVLTAR